MRRYRLLVLGPPLVLAAILIPLAAIKGLQFAFLLFVLVMASGSSRRSPAPTSYVQKDGREHEELEAPTGVTVLGTRRTRTSADIPDVSGSRPVMLVTFDVPFEPEASALAVDAAVESGQRLIVVNLAEVPIGPISLAMKYEYVGTQEVEDALRAPAELAHSLAVDVERLRLCSPRPIEALLELVAERAPGLLVVGPDRERLKRRTYAKWTKRISERAACLVWLPG